MNMFHVLQARIKSMARRESGPVKLLGVIEITLGIALLAPAVIALIYGEDPVAFICPVPVLLVLGTLQYIFFKSGETMKPASGMLMIFAAWWITFFVSMIPFCLYGLSPIDSFFEAVSGFTTTGISVMGDASIPRSIIFWGAFTQWAGGIAIILIFLFLIPMMGIGGRAFVNNELAGSSSYNFTMRIKSAVMNFMLTYVILSVLEAVLLTASGLAPFEAVTMMFSTISTGGFMASGNSMADYSFITQAVVVVFMFLGGTNFYLHYRAVNKREFSAYKTSQEFIWTVIWFVTATALIAAVILMNAGDISSVNIGGTLWDSLFTVVSFGTTTGYSVSDNLTLPFAAYIILWMVMLFGSMSGSTSGGIKIYRLLILKSYVTNGIYRMLHPRSVRDVRMDGHSVSNDTVVSAMAVVVMFAAALIASVFFLLVSEPGMSISESIGLSISVISNSGMNLGTVTYHELSGLTKIFLAFMMWVGRLEVVMALLIFTRAFWSDLILDIKGSRYAEKNRKG